MKINLLFLGVIFELVGILLILAFFGLSWSPLWALGALIIGFIFLCFGLPAKGDTKGQNAAIILECIGSILAGFFLCVGLCKMFFTEYLVNMKTNPWAFVITGIILALIVIIVEIFRREIEKAEIE